METANIATPQKHFTLAEMSKVMMDRTKIPVGFFVSQALWDGLSARVHKEEGFGLGNGPILIQGIKVAIDPAMPDAEFDVAFTEEAWSKRLLSISNGERG